MKMDGIIRLKYSIWYIFLKCGYVWNKASVISYDYLFKIILRIC